MTSDPGLADRWPRMTGFTVGEQLGCGGSARVWSATRQRDGAAVALKVSHIAGRDAELRFAREARALAEVGTPFAPALHAEGQLGDGRPYLAMERVAGTSPLAQIARIGREAGTATLGAIAVVVGAILDALHAVHERGLVHLDLKPDNTLLARREPDATRQCVLLDFGLSQRRSAEPASRPRGRGGEVVLGSVEYIAPERLTGNRTVDQRADIYSFGVMLYQMLTGRLPFRGDREAILRGHTSLRPTYPSTLASMPGEVEALCLACLAKRPEDRPADAASLSRDLIDALRRRPSRRRGGATRSNVTPVIGIPVASPGSGSGTLGASRQPVVLLVVQGSPSSHGTVSSVVEAHGGFIARRFGPQYMCGFTTLAGHSPWRAAFAAARDLSGHPETSIALHMTEARVRQGKPRRILGREIERPASWLPTRSWTGVLASPALAEALPAGVVEPTNEPPSSASHDGAAASWFQPVSSGLVHTGAHELYIDATGALDQARRAARICLARSATTLFTVIGDHGMGKSRLCVEIARMIADEAPDISPMLVQVSRVAADPSGPSGTTDPTLGVLAREIERVVEVPLPVETMSELDAVRAVGDGLRRAAAIEPLAVILDDCHRASDALLAAVEYAALAADGDGKSAGAALWLCVAAGPELLRRQPRWGQRVDHHIAVQLEPLSPADASRLAAALLLPAEYPPPALLERLATMSAGNPYLLVESCRNLVR